LEFTEQEILNKIALFFWPMVRISALFIAIPVFSARSAPVKVRVMISFFTTLIVIPFLPALPNVELMSYYGVLITFQQMVIGLISAFILQMVFSVMLVAGQSIAYSMGLGFASMVDPASGVQVPVVAQIFVVSASLFFISMNAHLLAIEIIIQSFSSLPIALVSINMADLWVVIIWSGQMFAGGVLLALPIMATILFINISFGVASKAAPQIQIFGIGFPIFIMTGLILIWVMIPNLLTGFSLILIDGFDLVKQVLRV